MLEKPKQEDTFGAASLCHRQCCMFVTNMWMLPALPDHELKMRQLWHAWCSKAVRLQPACCYCCLLCQDVCSCAAASSATTM